MAGLGRIQCTSGGSSAGSHRLLDLLLASLSQLDTIRTYIHLLRDIYCSTYYKLKPSIHISVSSSDMFIT